MDEDATDAKDNGMPVGDEGAKKNRRGISKMELLAQSFVMLIAGYDSTGNTMHFVLYHLAKLPGIQERVQEEIDRVVGDEVGLPWDVCKG